MAEESGVWLQRWKLSNCFVEVGTHCPKARVSAAEKAEEPMCYGGTFLKRGCRGGKSRIFLEAVETHRPKARVSAVGKAD